MLAAEISMAEFDSAKAKRIPLNLSNTTSTAARSKRCLRIGSEEIAVEES